MIVEMERGIDVQQVDGVVQRAKSLGFQVQLNLGTDKIVIAILGGNTGQAPTAYSLKSTPIRRKRWWTACNR